MSSLLSRFLKCKFCFLSFISFINILILFLQFSTCFFEWDILCLVYVIFSLERYCVLVSESVTMFHSDLFGYRLVPRLESAQPRAEAAQRRLPQRRGLRGAEAPVPPPRPGRHRRETHGLLHVERSRLRHAQLLHLWETTERRRFVVDLSFILPYAFMKFLPFLPFRAEAICYNNKSGLTPSKSFKQLYLNSIWLLYDILPWNSRLSRFVMLWNIKNMFNNNRV